MKTIQAKLNQFTILPRNTVFKGQGVFELSLPDVVTFPVQEKLYEARNGVQAFKKAGYTKR